MVILVALIALIIIIADYSIEKKMTTPVKSFSFVWLLISVLVSMRLLPLNVVSSPIYIIVAIGMISYAIGALTVSRNNVIRRTGNVYDENKFRRYFIYLQILALILFIIEDIVVITLLRSGYGMDDIYHMRIQMAYGADTMLSNGTLASGIGIEYIARPILAISVPFTAVDYYKNNNKKTLLLTISLLILGYISKANRMDILMAIGTFFFVKLFFLQKVEYSFKRILQLIMFVSVFYLLFNFLTVTRGSESDILSTFYYYVCGNMPFFDVMYHKMGSDFDFTFGLTSLQGIIRPFGQTLNAMGVEMPKIYKLSEMYSNVEDAVYIGGSSEFNAFIGPFYFFYCDFGYLGVILLSFLYGRFVQILYRNALKSQDILPITIFVMIFIRGVLFSFYNFLFVGITYGMSILIAIVLRRLSIKK